jgi:DNA-binding beta-propeller fold protein YncE
MSRHTPKQGTTVRQNRYPIKTVLCGFLVLLATTCGLAATVAPSVALAGRAHAFSSVLGGCSEPQKVKDECAAAGQLSLASLQPGVHAGSGVAVDDASHDVFVADTGNRRVDEFDPAEPEQFIRAWGWGVLNGKAELQVCTTATGCRQGLSGSGPGEFEVPGYVAVDNDPASASFNDVYVGDTGDDLVSKFDAEGQLQTGWGNNGENSSHERIEPNGQSHGSSTGRFDGGISGQPLAGIAVDTSGDLIVFDKKSEMGLFELDQAGISLTTCTVPLQASPAIGGVSVATTGDLYVFDGGGRVQRVEPGCANPGIVTIGTQTPTGLAVDTFDDDLYVDQGGSLIEDIPSSCVPMPDGCSASQLFGEEQLSGAGGIAVDPGTGAVYAANSTTDEILLFGLAIEAESAPASGVLAHTATLHGTVNPVGAELSHCQFEYGETESYGSIAGCSESDEAIGTGRSPVPVDAPVLGLDGGKAYHFRLHATNANGGVYGEDETLETPVTAVIAKVSASEPTGSSALLQAEVNPKGLAAEYHFEYGSCEATAGCAASSFPNSTAIVPLAAGSATVAVSQPITGLEANSTYHFRIVVKDADGTATPSPEGTFVAEPEAPGCETSRPVQDAHLADCRGYEMVTPLHKDGALIENGGILPPGLISADGSRVVTRSIQCLSGPESCIGIRSGEGEPYAFERTAAGWVTNPLAPPSGPGYTTTLSDNANTGMTLFAKEAASPALEELYARGPDGTIQAIGPIGEQPGTGPLAGIAQEFRVSTGDLSRVLYQDYGGQSIWPSLEAGLTSKGMVYEYSGRDNSRPTLLGDIGCASSIGGSNDPHSDYGSLSADGRIAFFTMSGPCAAVPTAVRELYARIENAEGARTALISAPTPGVCDAACESQPAEDVSFQGAVADGSRVFFTSTQQLTDSASEDKSAGDSAFTSCLTTSSTTGCNLYESECPSECEHLADRRLVDVSAGDSSGLGPQVQGVLAIPSAGSDVYFVAHGVLTETPNKSGQVAIPGGDNLYVYRASGEGRSGGTTFIATLSPSDEELWHKFGGISTANVTPDGRFLVFTSHRALTADVSHREGPAQVYRYDADSEQLTRVSVGEQGFDDNGNNSIADAAIVPAENGFVTGQGPGRADPTMSDDGRLVFFESSAGLTPDALNDQPVTGNPGVLAENVYEWEANGAQPSEDAPACGQPAGCVSLVSDGRDVTEGTGGSSHHASGVQLLGTDTTGSNVFFWTADQLVPGDTDSQVDLYDARVNGGFPAQVEPQPCVSSEACREPPLAPPVSGVLASSVFSGAGNLTPGLVTPVEKRSVKPLTRAQKLATALKQCKKDKSKHKRTMCEKAARKRYGPIKKTNRRASK